MTSTGKSNWQIPVACFILFNLLGTPLIGRAVWTYMQTLEADSARLAAVGLSLVGAVGILAVNGILTLWATGQGLPRIGQMTLWLITGAIFLLPIGFGFFSPVNMVIALFRAAVG